MADIRVKDLTEAAVPGADYYLLTDSAADGPRKIKPSNIVTKTDIGLGDVDNTADADKPISTATQTALDGKATSAQGALADSAVQPDDLGALAAKNKAAISDIDAVGTTDGSHYLRGDGLWGVPAGGGDVLAADTFVADRTALAALNGVTSPVVHLREAGRAGNFIFDASDLSARVSADPQQGVYVPPSSDATGASGAWGRGFNEPLNVEWFGAKDGMDCSAAINGAIAELRKYPKDNIDTVGGDVITMYRSGTIKFGPGVFMLPAGTLELVADMGIRFQGAGHRGMTNALQGRTTLLVTGTNDQFGIRIHRGGARSIRFQDMDICYETAGFTGDLIYCLDAPRLGLEDCFLGTFGISGDTRNQSANSLVRLTYDEGAFINRCVFDGAARGVYLDDVTEELGNSGFGGWGTSIRDTVFYDFTNTHIIQTGIRRRYSLTLDNVAINPINVNPVRGVNLTNILGLSVRGLTCVSSVASTPSVEWVLLDSCRGSLTNSSFGELARAGTIQGNGAIDLSNNIIFADKDALDGNGDALFPSGVDGFRLKGGVITGAGNRFYSATNGFLLQNDGTNAVILANGPDMFGGTNSIKIASDSALYSGEYRYNANSDLSSAKYTNAATNVSIVAIDGPKAPQSFTPATPTASSGAFTSVSAALNYKRERSYVHVQGKLTVTTLGTATGRAIIQMPVAAKASRFFPLNAMLERGFAQAVAAVNWDTTSYLSINLAGLTNGDIVYFNGSYEAA